MGQMIKKPDTNPLVSLLLNVLICAGVGYLYMGQQRKGIIALVIYFVGGLLSCGVLLLIWPIVTGYDAYLLSQRLQGGQQIGENENALPFLNNIFKD